MTVRPLPCGPTGLQPELAQVLVDSGVMDTWHIDPSWLDKATNGRPLSTLALFLIHQVQSSTLMVCMSVFVTHQAELPGPSDCQYSTVGVHTGIYLQQQMYGCSLLCCEYLTAHSPKLRV